MCIPESNNTFLNCFSPDQEPYQLFVFIFPEIAPFVNSFPQITK